jgi:hypothetical protein
MSKRLLWTLLYVYIQIGWVYHRYQNKTGEMIYETVLAKDKEYRGSIGG